MSSGPGFAQSPGFPMQANVFPAYADGKLPDQQPQDAQNQGQQVQGDSNSPKMFMENLETIQTSFLGEVLQVSRMVLDGMQNAYHKGNSPSKSTAYIQALRGQLEFLARLLLHSGVGGLPVVNRASTDPPTIFTEAQLEAMTKESIDRLYEQLDRSHRAAGAVASLIDAPLQEPVNRTQ
ncbi:uncharacterized protein SCHCODRAFT_02131424 [Schizophyllum commune H4-8]|uniref:Expressed protein n=1 Tax=Schizophyllum commune (strain H4-8 / FGSC 9210) TaxID=578458 RepID=D8QKH1_SCHCM|nr:uncharacterized protein SCHCODRAFT_02131424 [Schizophyllum commune H4-8]KAI5885109.1 hypothetical protein SCHCODRAFT_02131424 [Schizophyllum commune H4-8]